MNQPNSVHDNGLDVTRMNSRGETRTLDLTIMSQGLTASQPSNTRTPIIDVNVTPCANSHNTKMLMRAKRAAFRRITHHQIRKNRALKIRGKKLSAHAARIKIVALNPRQQLVRADAPKARRTVLVVRTKRGYFAADNRGRNLRSADVGYDAGGDAA